MINTPIWCKKNVAQMYDMGQGNDQHNLNIPTPFDQWMFPIVYDLQQGL